MTDHPGKLILIVDDVAAVRLLIQLALNRAGYETATAPNGRSVVRMCHEQPVSLIITDLVMPDIDGIEIIAAVRRDFPKLPIIAISGMVADQLGTAAMLGANATLEKPLDLQRLIRTVRTLLELPE
jgi:CheY-like chemotaxis protein